MKNKIVIVAMLTCLLFLFQAFISKVNRAGEIPDEVNKVLVTSCYDCHTSGAKNEDAREALNFEKWDDYRITKQIGLLGKIEELVGEGKMPPTKYLNFKPEKKLTSSFPSVLPR